MTRDLAVLVRKIGDTDKRAKCCRWVAREWQYVGGSMWAAADKWLHVGGRAIRRLQAEGFPWAIEAWRQGPGGAGAQDRGRRQESQALLVGWGHAVNFRETGSKSVHARSGTPRKAKS